MSRLIDADELIRKMRNDVPIKLFGSMKNLGNVVEIVDDAPTVDAEPIRHGEWIYPYELFDINECSLCGFAVQDKISNVPLMFHYCPNCGAKMDGEGEDETN